MKKKILFLCIGNSCRSQMAEGFARCYGSDVMEPASAGLAPATIVQPLTKQVMQTKNINIDDQFPKDVNSVPLSKFDLVINMSGSRLPARTPVPVREWKIEDPIGKPEAVYAAVCNQIENEVMRLILEFRREQKQAQPAAPEPTPVKPATPARDVASLSTKTALRKILRP